MASPRRQTASAARRALRALADPARARLVSRYFKTGKGEYGEGDRFIGVTMPQLRTIAREFRAMPIAEADVLLRSPVHEDRMLALVILGHAYARGDEPTRVAIYRLYLARTAYINNWDLVDVSAPGIVGHHLESRSRAPLDRLAKSGVIWERRIAMLSTMWFLRDGETAPALRLAARLVDDPHDLMHKAVGWLLREAAKQNKPAVTAFLRRHAAQMPRTMLRYAIERMPAAERARFMGMAAAKRRRSARD